MRTIAAILLLAMGMPLLALSPVDFDDVVDFEMSAATLYELVQAEAYDAIDAERFMVLEGTIASTMVLDPNPDSYQALVEIVQGEWIGLTDIEIYRVYVLLIGPDFADRVPERMPRDPGPEILRNGDSLLVVGAFYGVSDAEDGTRLPVVEAIAIRK
jgi:hypothetical protein